MKKTKNKSITNKERKDLFSKYLENLKVAKEQRVGDLAILKRASGLTLAESRGALGIFYRYLPPQLSRSINEEIYFLIATLYGLNDFQFTGSFGKTMREVFYKSGSDSIQKRFIALLDSRFDLIDTYLPGGGEVAYRIRQCIRLASSNNIGVDWLQLLKDLVYWTHEEKFIQKKWAQDFFSKNELNESSEKIDKNKQKKIKK